MTEFTLNAHEILNEWDENYLNLLNDSDEYRYIDIGVNNPKYFSYIPKCKLKLFEDNTEKYLRNKYAVEIKPTRLMNKILKEPITTKQSEKLLGIIGKYDSYEFKIIEGEDIIKYYSSKCIENPSAMLEKSCMVDKPEEYFKLYIDKAKLIILQNPSTNEIVGRALLWKANLNNIEINFMDRVYADTIPSIKFKKYATDNNFYMRDKEERYLFYYKDEKFYTQEVKLRLIVDANSYKYIPYMDTFVVHRKDHLGTVDFYNWMQDNNGGHSYCCKCDKKMTDYGEKIVNIYNYSTSKIDKYCSNCIEEHKIEIKGKRYRLDNQNIRYCVICKTYHIKEDVVSYNICKTCWNEKYIKINGRKYSKKGNKVYYNEENGEWLLK